MADQLATDQDLASLLQLNYATLTTAQKATLTMLVELATAKVQRMAGGQRIVDATDTAVIDVTDPCDSYLSLPQLPVRSVSSVELDGEALAIGTDVFVRSQMLWRAGGWMRSWSPPTQVVVAYTHGYTTGSQWLHLGKDTTLSLAVMGWGNPGGVVESESIDDYRVSYGQADARMQPTEWMQDAIAAAYGTAAYVSLSRT